MSKAFMLLGIFLTTSFTLIAQPPSEVAIQARDAAMWEAMSVRERRLYVEGYAAGQMALIIDMRPMGGEFMDRAYGLSILGTPIDHYLSHLDEIYEQPGFRHVPVAITVQLAHHYVWQIRSGYRIPLSISEEARIKGR